jgi:hypothetical protein
MRQITATLQLQAPVTDAVCLAQTLASAGSLIENGSSVVNGVAVFNAGLPRHSHLDWQRQHPHLHDHRHQLSRCRDV